MVYETEIVRIVVKTELAKVKITANSRNEAMEILKQGKHQNITLIGAITLNKKVKYKTTNLNLNEIREIDTNTQEENNMCETIQIQDIPITPLRVATAKRSRVSTLDTFANFPTFDE